MKALIIAAVTLMATAAYASQPLIPAPVSYKAESGQFMLPASPSVSGTAAKSVAKYFGQIGIPAKKAGKGCINVSLDSSLAPESYNLSITPEGISITAADEHGLFYAVQSIAQLKDGNNIECCTIEDSPRFGYRGLMLDVSRYFMPAADIRKIIDVAARLKFNNLHLHLSDDNGWRLEIKKYPKLTQVGAWRVDREDYFPGRLNQRSADEPTPVGGFYTQKEMRELVKYAADRNINIIPEIEVPAHAAAAIASYPELACPVVDKFVGVYPGIGGKDASIIMCAGKESTFKFIEDVLDEVMDIFPSQYIHIGGDEADKTVWRECPECNAKIEELGLHNHEELQAYLMDRVAGYLSSKGRKSIGWDEVTYGDPKQEMTIFGWQGDGGIAVRDSKKSGRDFVLTPAKVFYLIRYQGPQWFEPFTYFGNNTLDDCYNYEPVGADWDDTLKSHLKGVQGSLWCEFCKSADDVEYQIFPRLMAIADVAWRPEGRRDWTGFLNALDRFLPYLDHRGVTYAKSMYNLDHKVTPENGKLKATASCIRPDVDVKFSFNEDFSDSKPFNEYLTIDKPATIYASTFKHGKQIGKTLVLPLSFNKATGKTVTSTNCNNGLHNMITNGLRGSDRNSDFEWAGWHDRTAEFIVDLGETTHINSVKLGNLVHSDICVAAPREVLLFTSDNGKGYTLRNTLRLSEAEQFHPKALVKDLDLGNPDVDARYIKVVAVNPGCFPDGHAREGTPSWLYFDEITVE